ncbi:aldehyde dehydrogenase family protein [Pseudaminobacter sp. 19-2017]|uniref:Aldehyde dehydrogenase family protein n=1 Tax=Pseudaminobacter soli (ex Zhang et al. 2022) TaxID=2831468 RepID=A0A942DYC4_9HYPH|nr:aldehyde dehydrogenase family protein [Pseudaminobacter soli]MBS3647621.1 aldehyde dehydrogenase family protein [Pseudaminobacter soli]
MTTDKTILINGLWEAGADAGLPVIDPATEAEFAVVPSASHDQVSRAVEAAAAAQPAWAALEPWRRADALRAMRACLLKHQQELAELVSREVGKPLRKAREDVENAGIYLEYMAQWDRRIEGEIVPADNRNETILLNRVPIGVVAAITAWNYPLDLFIRKAAPALISGNTLVVKPTEVTPLATIRAIQLITDENCLPPGVLNLVTGGGAVGAALTSHPLVNMITMTGHRDTGKKIMAAAAANLSRVSLELGGSAPAIIWKDADLDLAADAIAFASFENTGQVCTSSERILVHEDVHDAFVARLVERAERLRVGSPSDDLDLGPLVNRVQFQKVTAAIDLAQAEGAELHCGGYGLPSLPGRGYWVRPTVMTGVTPKMSLFNQETFGPIAPIIRVSRYDEAIRHANATRYGLTAFVFSNDYRLVMRAQDELRFGEIFINRTMGEALQGFHTGHMESGMGGEDGKHGVLKYTQLRAVYHSYA